MLPVNKCIAIYTQYRRITTGNRLCPKFSLTSCWCCRQKWNNLRPRSKGVLIMCTTGCKFIPKQAPNYPGVHLHSLCELLCIGLKSLHLKPIINKVTSTTSDEREIQPPYYCSFPFAIFIYINTKLTSSLAIPQCLQVKT